MVAWYTNMLTNFPNVTFGRVDESITRGRLKIALAILDRNETRVRCVCLHSAVQVQGIDKGEGILVNSGLCSFWGFLVLLSYITVLK